MRTIIGTLLSIILISCYSFAEQLGIPDLGEGEGRILYAQTALDSQDREIGIKRYSDPSVFPMIGWRGMIIETDDRDSTYYIEISNYEEDMLTPPRYIPNTQASRIPWRAVQNRFAEGPNDEKSLRLAPGQLDWAFSEFDMDFSYGPEDDRYTIVQEFSEGTVGNKHYAFIPSRLSRGRSYRDVIESTLHTTGSTIYYRWWRLKVGEELVSGDIHSFVNPRKISIAMLGDSFGSGEGAPSKHPTRAWMEKEDTYWSGKVPSGWIYANPSHRSLNSGFELALKKWIHTYPDFAINFGNYSWSGAIAYLPPINHNERYQSDRIEEEKYKGPKTMWGQLTQLNIRGPHTKNNSKTIDALFINMGGNDAGFGDIIKAHLTSSNFDKSSGSEKTEKIFLFNSIAVFRIVLISFNFDDTDLSFNFFETLFNLSK